MTLELAKLLEIDGRHVQVTERSSKELSPHWAEFVAHAPWLQVEHVRVPGLAAPTTELVGSDPHGSIIFVGEIEAEQLRALVAVLRTLATDPEWTHPDAKLALADLPSAVDLEVFVSPLCPFSATVSAAVLRFAAATPDVSVRVIRSEAGKTPAGVHKLPTVRADGVIVAEGMVDEYTLLRQISTYQRSVPPVSTVFALSRPRDFPSGVRSAAPTPEAPSVRSPRPGSTAA